MTLDIDVSEVVAKIIVGLSGFALVTIGTAIGWVFRTTWHNARDLNAAFEKIRDLERRNGP